MGTSAVQHGNSVSQMSNTQSAASNHKFGDLAHGWQRGYGADAAQMRTKSDMIDSPSTQTTRPSNHPAQLA
jgi:hypothetical protein